MTVAAFLKSNLARDGAGGGKAAPPPPGTLEDFFAQYDYADCSPADLLALAELATRCGDQNVARTALQRLVQAGKRLHQARYKLGRMDAQAKDFAAAAEHFRAGTEADPNFAFNWMGAARAFRMLGRKDEACLFAERFVTFGVRPHAENELATLADLGDYLFDAQQRPRSLPLYALVVKFNAAKPRDAVRLAWAHMSLGDYAAALTVLRAQNDRQPLDVWARQALSICCSQTGDHATAIAVAEAVALEDPANRGFVSTYLDALARARDVELMRDAMARHGDWLQEAGTTELLVRVQLADGDIEGAAATLAAREFAYHDRLYHLALEAAYAALGAGLIEVSIPLGQRLAALAPDDLFVKLLRIDTCFRQQLWETASEILADMPIEERDKPQVLLKRFECASFLGDVALAEELRARLVSLEMPNKQFALPVFRFLAEQGRWDELVDRALGWLDGQLNYAQIGYVLFRAAKHTGRQHAIIDAVEAVAGWQAHADLVRLRANLAFDLATTPAEIEKLANDPTITGDDMLRRKLAIKRDVLLRAQSKDPRRAIFLCSDRNYLAATFVALHSLTRVTKGGGAEDFFIVLDNDLVDLARRATEPFTQCGFSVTVVAASDVIESAEKLYASYGLFTSGHQLSSAAYYRIYFAKHLASLNKYQRAIYVDSDILVRGPLDPLFAADLGGFPLAARLEPMRPEVRRAIALHQLADNRYFNSGVLVFDLQHERLAADLDGAVAAIMDDNVTLLFHDQCALNLGFRNDFTDLDLAWNYVVTEPTKRADIPADVAILHFLDRPKPWSAAHGGDAALLWFERWRETAAFIGEPTAVELFALIAD